MVGCGPDGSDSHESGVWSTMGCEACVVSNDQSGKGEPERDGEVSHDLGRLASECVPSDEGVGDRSRWSYCELRGSDRSNGGSVSTEWSSDETLQFARSIAVSSDD